MSTEVALKHRIADMIVEYDHKKEALPSVLKEFQQAGNEIQTACTIQGTFGQTNIDVGRIYESHLEESLLKSAWLNLHKTLSLDILMSAKDQKRFEQSMSHLPEFTIDNIRATFGDYVLDPWGNILRGLAEVFSDLDQSYKSHEKVKIGVEGLPKRIIMRGFGDFSYWGWEKMADVVNALASYQNKSLLTYFQLKQAIEDNGEDHFLEERGFSLRLFKNGNGHMIFNKETLKDINRALAEYYGEVLADGYEAKPDQPQQSTEVSKDLQYYPTPKDVVETVLESFYVREPELMLEPSCGCGRFMDGIKEKFPESVVHGIEFDAQRAEEARQKGHRVQTGNFLDTEPTPKYDRVIMNPPFYGKHYAKHIEHAMKFLKEGGTLVAILPVTARYDHGLVDGHWSDLPVGSFQESGTNINTTILTINK